MIALITFQTVSLHDWFLLMFPQNTKYKMYCLKYIVSVKDWEELKPKNIFYFGIKTYLGIHEPVRINKSHFHLSTLE